MVLFYTRIVQDIRSDWMDEKWIDRSYRWTDTFQLLVTNVYKTIWLKIENVIYLQINICSSVDSNEI